MTDFPPMPAPRPTVRPVRGSRLDQLQARYPELKRQAKAAADELKDCTDALKRELAFAAGEDATDVDLDGSMIRLRLSYIERWTLDSKRLKTEQPETYVAFARKGGSYQLREIADDEWEDV
jgi:hypothetical protein